MPKSELLGAPAIGSTTLAQRLPSQCSIKADSEGYSPSAPTTQISLDDRAAMPLSVAAVFTAGCGITLQAFPFQRRIVAWPTAHTSFDETAAIAVSAPTLGLWTRVQVLPSQCSRTEVPPGPLPYEPTP